MNPRYSRESNDSAIASFTESDIDVDTFWESDQNCSNMGQAALLPVKSMALSKDKNARLGKTHFRIHVVTNSRPVVFSSTQAGSPLDLPRPGPMSLSTSTASCLCEGICSLCHMAEFRPLEARVDQWPKHSACRMDLIGTEVDAYPFDETHDAKAAASWNSYETLYDAKQKYWAQCAHDDILADVDPETLSTQPSPPDNPYLEAHFASAKEDYDSTEEDTETQYEQLVENIANLVVKSNWIGHVEDDCGPIVQCTHAYLENIRNNDDIFNTGGKLHVSCTSSSPCADGDGSGPNLGGQAASGAGNGNRKRKQGSGHSNNRGNRDNDGETPNGNGADDFDDTEDWSGDKKRARVDHCQKLPCPYRKRNPTRFNVRKHTQCALNSFASMALLK